MCSICSLLTSVGENSPFPNTPETQYISAHSLIPRAMRSLKSCMHATNQCFDVVFTSRRTINNRQRDKKNVSIIGRPFSKVSTPICGARIMSDGHSVERLVNHPIYLNPCVHLYISIYLSFSEGLCFYINLCECLATTFALCKLLQCSRTVQ